MSENVRLRTASLCYTDIVKYAKQGHPAFSRSTKNGKVYFNISIWDNEGDQVKFGNDVGIQLSPPKESEAERPYIGNGKKMPYQPNSVPLAATTENSANDDDDLPF